MTDYRYLLYSHLYQAWGAGRSVVSSSDKSEVFYFKYTYHIFYLYSLASSFTVTKSTQRW